MDNHPPHPLTRTQAAFILSAQRLFDIGEKVYFWTFTFTEVHHDWHYPMRWKGFITEIGHIYGGYICGLRVLEAHKEHGLHYHALINRRIAIQFVLRIGKKHGIGRVDVFGPVKMSSAFYLAKYLTKRGPKLFGVHRWGTIGCFRHVRVHDVQIITPYTKARKRIVGDTRIPIGWEHLLRTAFELHGPRRMRITYKLLRDGKLASAAASVTRLVEITDKGGIRTRCPLPPPIPFAVAKP